MSAIIDYKDLIGVPFEYGGRGPDTYDCYGVVTECHRRLGKRIPEVRSPEVLEEIEQAIVSNRSKWRTFATKPATGDIPFSELQPGRSLEIRVKGLACHVGFIHRPRHFLHTWEHSGGVVENQIADWRPRILAVYEYVG